MGSLHLDAYQSENSRETESCPTHLSECNLHGPSTPWRLPIRKPLTDRSLPLNYKSPSRPYQEATHLSHSMYNKARQLQRSKKTTIISKTRFEQNCYWFSLLYITKFLYYNPHITNVDTSNKCDINTSFDFACLQSSWEKKQSGPLPRP